MHFPSQIFSFGFHSDKNIKDLAVFSFYYCRSHLTPARNSVELVPYFETLKPESVSFDSRYSKFFLLNLSLTEIPEKLQFFSEIVRSSIQQQK